MEAIPRLPPALDQARKLPGTLFRDRAVCGTHIFESCDPTKKCSHEVPGTQWILTDPTFSTHSHFRAYSD